MGRRILRSILHNVKGLSMVAPFQNVNDCRKLAVRPALRRLIDLAGRQGSVGSDLTKALSDFEKHGVGVDTVGAFELVVNRCLDSGYRGEGLLAFVFLALNRRFAARIRKRLKASPLGARTVDVEDLVMIAMEGVQKVFYRSDRTHHSVTYSLLLSIADHRAIDYLRRKKADLVPCVDTAASLDREQLTASWRPDQQFESKERETLLRLVRGAILESVNTLTEQQRRALILVEVEGVGYRDVARRLEMKETDVGNYVRRARKVRDGNFIAALRKKNSLVGHIGFAELQRSKELRTNLLRWAADIGDGFCYRCVNESATLHTADQECHASLPARVDGLNGKPLQGARMLTYGRQAARIGL